MDREDYIKVLKNITYDREELFNFYNTIKHRAKNYIEIHASNITEKESKSPYFRCICKNCVKMGRHTHSGNDHKVIRRLERYKNKEVLRLIDELQYITKTTTPNWPTIWIYAPNFNLPPHIDFARKSSIIIPIFPEKSTVHIYENNLPIVIRNKWKYTDHNDNYVKEIYEYDTKHPNVLNANKVIHGVFNGKEERIYLNFSGYCEWNDI